MHAAIKKEKPPSVFRKKAVQFGECTASPAARAEKFSQNGRLLVSSLLLDELSALLAWHCTRDKCRRPWDSSWPANLIFSLHPRRIVWCAKNKEITREERVKGFGLVRPSNWRTNDQGDRPGEEVFFANSHKLDCLYLYGSRRSRETRSTAYTTAEEGGRISLGVCVCVCFYLCFIHARDNFLFLATISPPPFAYFRTLFDEIFFFISCVHGCILQKFVHCTAKIKSWVIIF